LLQALRVSQLLRNTERLREAMILAAQIMSPVPGPGFDMLLAPEGGQALDFKGPSPATLSRARYKIDALFMLRRRQLWKEWRFSRFLVLSPAHSAF